MRQDPNALVRLATYFYGAVIAVALVWSALFGHSPLGDATPSRGALAQGLLIGIGIVLACHLAHRLFRAVRRASEFLSAFLGPISPLQAVWLALLSGFAEELLFRGALWPQLGLVGTSVFFGLCHTLPVRALAGYPIFAFFAGLLFGITREHSGSIWPAVLAHTTVNALNLAWLGRRADEPAPPEPAPPPPAPEQPVRLPRDLEVGESFPFTAWRYDLRLELRGTDRENLPLCLDHEELGLFRAVPREQVYEELRNGLFVFADAFTEPLPGFEHDLAALSAYLFQPVVGLEVAERHVDETTTDDVRAWKVVAQRGEWVKVPLEVGPAGEEGRFVIDPEREDVSVLAARWANYPRWFQDAMRFKYPNLRDL